MQDTMQSDVDVKRRHGRGHAHQVFDVTNDQIFGCVLARLFLLFLIVIGFKVDEPLQRVAVIAIHAGDPALQILIAPIVPFTFLAALGFQLVHRTDKNGDGGRPIGNNEMGKPKSFLQQIIAISHGFSF